MAMALETIRPFIFATSTVPIEDSRLYTSYKQNVTAATAFITSQRTESGKYVLVRASTVDDNTLFLNELISKHSEVRDQISYLLFAIRESIPSYTCSTVVKARYQHGLSQLPKFSAAHTCLTPHLIDNVYFSILGKVTTDLSKNGKISEETRQELMLLFYENADQATFSLLVQSLEEINNGTNWQEQRAFRITQDKEIERIQSQFSKWVDALKHHYQKDSQALLIKIGQLYVAMQKIGKPSYPEIQECATAIETIKNIDQALLQIGSILDDQKTPFSPSILETTQASLQNIRGDIAGRIFYRLETLLEPYRRESIVSTSSVMYQNMNITTEFPQYVNAIIDLAIEMEFRDYSIYLHNQISHGKMSCREAFTHYCERKAKFLKELVETFEKQGSALDKIYPLILKIRSLANSIRDTDPKDVTVIFSLFSEIQEEWKIIKSLRTYYSPSNNRAFGGLNLTIKELLDSNNCLHEIFDRLDSFAVVTLRNARLNTVEGGRIRQTLENVLLRIHGQKDRVKDVFTKLMTCYNTDEARIRTLPVPVIKQFLFDFFDYFYDRFHQRQAYERVKNDEPALRQFISSLLETPSANNSFSELHMSSDPAPFFHHSLLSMKLNNEKKDLTSCSLEQLREFANSYLLNIYEPEFQKEREPFKDVLTEIRKLIRDQSTRVEFEEIRQRYAAYYNQTVPLVESPFEVLLREVGLSSLLTAPKERMLVFVDKFVHHLSLHPAHIIFIRESVATTVYQSLVKLSQTEFNEDAWQEMRSTVEKCREGTKIQLKGSLSPSDIPSLEAHFFTDPLRSREQIIRDITLKPTYLYLEPENSKLGVSTNHHHVDMRVEARLEFSEDTRSYTAIDTDPDGYTGHPSLLNVLERYVPSAKIDSTVPVPLDI